jgi:hypothetical protein
MGSRGEGGPGVNGASQRPSAAGQAVLERWHAAADATRRGEAASYGGDARTAAYAAALGRAPGVVAVFAAPGRNVVWSSYRGSWQQLPVETNTRPWPGRWRTPARRSIRAAGPGRQRLTPRPVPYY